MRDFHIAPFPTLSAAVMVPKHSYCIALSNGRVAGFCGGGGGGGEGGSGCKYFAWLVLVKDILLDGLEEIWSCVYGML